MASTLLKLRDSSGNMQVITTAEEAYIAYRASVYLAANFNDTWSGAITVGTAVSPDRAVGSYVNTYYNQAIGTHPGSSISSGSTTTTLRQEGHAVSPNANFRRPVTWDGTADGVKELTDAEMDAVADRLLAYMMVNEWAGPNMRIGTSAPTGYSAMIANFATDTQSSNGATTNYSIYRKTTTPTAPSATRCVCLKRSSYPSGTYSGIIEMTDTQIGDTFGRWIAQRMASSDDRVGRYLLTTSTPAALGYSGTWQSRGSMVDTKDTTAEIDYSADYSANYTRNSLNTFTGNFLGDYVGTRISTRLRATNYTRIRATNYVRTSYRYGRASYIGDYVGNFTGDFIGNFLGNYTGDYNYQRTRITDYVGDFTGDYVGNYTGNYVGTTISSTDQTINTYTLYVRVA